MGNENKGKSAAVLGAVSALAVSLGVSLSSADAASDQSKPTSEQMKLDAMHIKGEAPSSTHIKGESQLQKVDTIGGSQQIKINSAHIKGESQQIKIESTQHKVESQQMKQQ